MNIINSKYQMFQSIKDLHKGMSATQIYIDVNINIKLVYTHLLTTLIYCINGITVLLHELLPSYGLLSLLWLLM